MYGKNSFGKGLELRGATFVVALLLTLGVGCDITEPKAPSWEVEYNIPLLDEWIDIIDLIGEDAFSSFGGDSLFFIEFEESLDPIEIGSDISIGGLNQSVAMSMGNFTVPAIPAQPVNIGLNVLFPGLPPPTGFPIPAIPSFSVPPNTVVPFGSGFSGFSQVTIESGTMTVSVTNSTKLTFSALSVRLLDAPTDSTVLNIDVAGGVPIVHGETRVINPSLAGKSLGNNLKVEISGTSEVGTNILIDGSEEIVVQVSIGQMTVSSATAEIGEIDFDFSDTVTLPGDATITAATLASGTFTLSLDNQLAIPLELSIEMPNLTDDFGTPISFLLDPQPGQQLTDMRDLSDHTLVPGNDGMGNQTLELSINVHSPGSGGALVTLSADDSLSVTASMTDLVLASIQGILDSTTVTIPEETFDLASDSGNILDELRSVNLTDVELEFTVRHSIGFPASLVLTLVGEGGTPDPVTLNIEFDLLPGTPAAPDTSTEVLNGGNSNIVEFLNAFPETIRYSGSFTVGDGVTVGSVSSTSSLEADFRFSLPLAFDIVQPINIELDKEFQADGLLDAQDMEVEIQEATLTYRLSSTLGLNLEARFTTAADSALVYTDPDVELVLALQYPAATAADTVITITREQFETLENPFWSGVKITIPPTTPGSPFRLAKNDRLFIKAFATIKVLIDPDGGSGGKGGGR